MLRINLIWTVNADVQSHVSKDSRSCNYVIWFRPFSTRRHISILMTARAASQESLIYRMCGQLWLRSACASTHFWSKPFLPREVPMCTGFPNKLNCRLWTDTYANLDLFITLQFGDPRKQILLATQLISLPHDASSDVEFLRKRIPVQKVVCVSCNKNLWKSCFSVSVPHWKRIQNIH